jgi:hypothetical protein
MGEDRARSAARCAMSTARSNACRSRRDGPIRSRYTVACNGRPVPLTQDRHVRRQPSPACATRPGSRLPACIRRIPVNTPADLRHRTTPGPAARSAAASITSPIPAVAITRPSPVNSNEAEARGSPASSRSGIVPGGWRFGRNQRQSGIPADARPAPRIRFSFEYKCRDHERRHADRHVDAATGANDAATLLAGYTARCPASRRDDRRRTANVRPHLGAVPRGMVGKLGRAELDARFGPRRPAYLRDAGVFYRVYGDLDEAPATERAWPLSTCRSCSSTRRNGT